MALTPSQRKKRQRDKERANRDIVAGAVQASQEKHESATQRAERIKRALGYAEWLASTRPSLSPNATELERRQFYGYTVSETRSEEERYQAADRMIEKSSRRLAA